MIKKRNEKGEPLEGICFEVIANEDIYGSDHNLIYEKGKTVSVLTTNSLGFASLKGIPLGKYGVQEIQTLDGYQLKDTIYEVELTYQDQYTPIVFETLNVINYSIPKTKKNTNYYYSLFSLFVGGIIVHDKKRNWNFTYSK